MRQIRGLLFAALLLTAAFRPPAASRPQSSSSKNYLGFDANLYPGDEALPILRKTFSFAGYWLGPPPGEKINSWLGKRELLQSQGFGFVVLWNGRESRNLKSPTDARQKGRLDAEAAAKAARQEGFPENTIIFLDIEEGGRLSPAYHAYLHEWIDTLAREKFGAGVYCSSMPVDEGGGVKITTAQNLQDELAGRKLAFWTYNDACPPAPGCGFPQAPPAPTQGGFAAASVWQFAQSPRRKRLTAHCTAKYASDGNCYAPGDLTNKWFLDVDVADSPNPSGPEN